jgi:hypothetical protein
VQSVGGLADIAVGAGLDGATFNASAPISLWMIGMGSLNFVAGARTLGGGLMLGNAWKGTGNMQTITGLTANQLGWSDPQAITVDLVNFQVDLILGTPRGKTWNSAALTNAGMILVNFVITKICSK